MHRTRDRIALTLNWAENVLLGHTNARSSAPAVISCIEASKARPAGHIRTLSYKQLYDEVNKAVAALTKLGVKEGDRVVAVSPNNAEAVVMLLASASVGAIWSSCPPEFGITAIVERLEQIEPTFLLSADQYLYSGKIYPIYPKLIEVIDRLARNGLKNVVIVGQLESDREPKGALPRVHNDKVGYLSWNNFLKLGNNAPVDIPFNRGSASRPLWILYSSGTVCLACFHACAVLNVMLDRETESDCSRCWRHAARAIRSSNITPRFRSKGRVSTVYVRPVSCLALTFD